MAAIIGALRAELSASVAQFKTDMGKGSAEVKKFARSFDDAAKGMAKSGAIMSAALTAPLILFAKHATDAAVEAQELQGKFDSVFGGMSKDMNEWAKTTGDAMGRSTQQMQETANAFGNIFNAVAPNRKQAAELSKSFSQLALDFAAFQEISEEDALAALQSGLKGSTKALKEFGVFFTEDEVKVRAFKLGLMAANGELSAQAKVMATASIIQEKLAYTQGELARSAGSAEEQQKSMAAQMKEIGIAIGNDLLPVMLELMKGVRGLIDWFHDLSPEVRVGIEVVAGLAAVVGPILLVLGGMASAIAAVAKAAPAMAAGIRLITGASTGAAAGVSKLSAAISGLLLMPVAMDWGKQAGDAIGHQLGLIQAALANGISYDEAVRRYDIGLKKFADANARAAADLAHQQQVNDQLSISAQDKTQQMKLALADAYHAQEIKDAEAAAKARAAAEAKAEADAKAALEAELNKPSNIRRRLAQEAEDAARDWDNVLSNSFKDTLDLKDDLDIAFSDLQLPTLTNVLPDLAVDTTTLDTFNDGVDMLADGLTDVFMTGRDAGDMLKRLGMELLNMTLLQPALDMLVNTLRGWGASVFGGGGATGAGFDLFGSIGQGISSFFGGFFRQGGTLRRGEWGWAGENGPEPIFAGDTDMQVYPAGGAAGPGGVTVNVYAKDAPSFIRSERQIARDANRMLGRS